MMRKWIPILVLVGALTTSLASSLVLGHVRVGYPGSIDCQQGCDLVAGGWPFRYLVDQPGISPVGSVSLSDALSGADGFESAAFSATVLFWIVVWAATVQLARWLKRLGSR